MPNLPNDNTPPDPNDQNAQPVDTNNNPPPVDPAPVLAGGEDDDPEFANMTVRERALVSKARAQEKRKLYQTQENLKREVAEANAQIRQLRNAPPPTTPAAADNRDAQIDRLAQMIEDNNAQIREMREEEVQRRRQAELKQYAAQRINEMREQGKPVIASLVSGNSEADIDFAIGVARAEYVVTEEEIKARNGRGAPTNVTVRENNGRPAGVAPVVTPNSVVADPQDEIINDITSDPDAAVRSGSYGKNRNQLLGKLRRGFSYTGQS